MNRSPDDSFVNFVLVCKADHMVVEFQLPIDSNANSKIRYTIYNRSNP
jgi:hypothetical protein